MRYYFILLITIVLCLFNQCRPTKGKKDEPLRFNLTHSDYNMGNFMLGRGAGMIVTSDNHLIGRDPACDTFFYRQDANNPASFFRFGNKGQGPDDFSMLFTTQYIEDSIIGSYDVMTGTFYDIVFHSTGRIWKGKATPLKYGILLSAIGTAYGGYIGMGITPDDDRKMFTLFDPSGKRITSFSEFPYRDADERSVQVRGMAYQGPLRTNPSRTKFVYAAITADILYFYEIEASSVRETGKIENSYCKYSVDKSMGFRAPINSDNIMGHVDAYATEKYVYTLYSGKSRRAHPDGKHLESDEMRIYDWSGNLLKVATLDVPCKYLCVSADDRMMWAIAETPEPEIVRFDLSGLEK